MKQVRRELIAVFEAVVQTILGAPRCQPFSGVKRLLLRACGVELGRGVTIYPKVWIMVPSRKLRIGDRADISKGVMITVGDTVHIGNRTLIGYDSKILSSNHRIPPQGQSIVDAGHDHAPIHIGDDVWIGANVVVLPGVTIGSGAVVGAGSVVVKDVPANSIAVGTPARVVKERR